MTRSFKRTTRFDVNADKFLEVLIEPEFLEAAEKAQGAVSAVINVISRSDERLVYEVRAIQYARGVTGIDKSKTEVVFTTYTWDLKDRSCTWTYRSDHGDRVQVSGTMRVEPSGSESAVLHDEFTVTVKIPLLGGTVEGMVLKEVEKTYPDYLAVMRRFASS